MTPLKLRPHHILDILRNYGHDFEFKPHPYGHAVHEVAKILISNPQTPVQLVVHSDDICAPCKHLMQDGQCDDVLHQLDPPPSKQEYNDALDRKLLSLLDLDAYQVLTFEQYLRIINKHVPGLEKVCSHPKEEEEFRLEGLINGLKKLEIRR